MPEYKTQDSDKFTQLVNGVGGDRERCKKAIELSSVNDKARCAICVYKRSVPGNAHIQCSYDWLKGLKFAKVNILPLGNSYGIGQGFYMFPVLYDPIWQVVKCQAFNTVIDPDFTLDGKGDAIVSLMAVYQLIQNYALAVIQKPQKESGGKDNVKEEGNVERL
jgi:hypothetical protein